MGLKDWAGKRAGRAGWAEGLACIVRAGAAGERRNNKGKKKKHKGKREREKEKSLETLRGRGTDLALIMQNLLFWLFDWLGFA